MAFMLDLETVGTQPTTAVATIGVVAFDPKNIGADIPDEDVLYLKLDIDQQLNRHVRTYSADTLKWWKEQPKASYDETFGKYSDGSPRTYMHEALRQLSDFINAKSNKFGEEQHTVWAQGVVFDIGILDNMYSSIGWTPPWNFWAVRDSRTVFQVVDTKKLRKLSGTSQSNNDHTAVSDCKNQLKQLDIAMKMIRGEI